MTTDRARERARRAIEVACRSGLPALDLFERVAAHLRQVVAFDAACWHGADPATGLFGDILVQSQPPGSFWYAVENELFEEDVHRFADLARTSTGVGRLRHTARLRPSPRLRVFAADGFGDELRAAFRAADTCWGSAALFRRLGEPEFTASEAAFVTSVSTELAKGLRLGLLLPAADEPAEEDGPGLLLLGADGAVTAVDPHASRWLSEIENRPLFPGAPLPGVVYAVAAHARALAGVATGPEVPPPRVRVKARSGRWLVLHATALDGPYHSQVAVIIEPAAPREVGELMERVYGLSSRERQVLGLVLRGLATKEIAQQLRISPWTVQDHLKAIFDKVGVRTRGELAACIFQGHYLARLEIRSA